ncbi:MAG: exosome complex RNA-binding protein Csl4 [Candidatus Heimdallarchaeota archaeon]|nr:exosome complex RNA-binding protein Csl4 [Candidatus Heimdallarchaeota archaeon]MBY8995619.1 exosome complex RNA-binding protein Csl4 [Candidatus Heimdallarchaeota archaeon]
MISNGLFLLPGDEICNIEEALPGEGTHVAEGMIFATVTGTLFQDKRRRTVSIFPKVRKPLVPKRDDVIIGQADSVNKHMVSLAVKYINGQSVEPPYSAIMHISHCTRAYLDSMFDAIKEGDIVRGKITDAHTIPLQFTTTYNELGVIYGLCSICGEKLHYLRRGTLKCDHCGNVEPRKVAEDYGRARL